MYRIIRNDIFRANSLQLFPEIFLRKFVLKFPHIFVIQWRTKSYSNFGVFSLKKFLVFRQVFFFHLMFFGLKRINRYDAFFHIILKFLEIFFVNLFLHTFDIQMIKRFLGRFWVSDVKSIDFLVLWCCLLCLNKLSALSWLYKLFAFKRLFRFLNLINYCAVCGIQWIQSMLLDLLLSFGSPVLLWIKTLVRTCMDDKVFICSILWPRNVKCLLLLRVNLKMVIFSKIVKINQIFIFLVLLGDDLWCFLSW